MQVNDEILAIKDIILKTVDCEKIFLFGSFAYGTPTPDSDYDFYVVVKDDAENPLEIMGKVYFNISKTRRIRRDIDLIGQYKSRFEERSKLRTIEKTIIEKGALLYDKRSAHAANV
jgi:predicted nucleotidyltransferase